MPASRPPIVVVAPDSFKGSLAAPAICAAIARGLRRVWPDAEVRACPMADGGEGTLDAVLSRGGRAARRAASPARAERSAPPRTASSPRPKARTAIIEVGARSWASPIPTAWRSPVTARSTRGVGELIAALLDAGVRRFMIGLGGSSTNDGGAGMLAALGLRLVDGDGPRRRADAGGIGDARRAPTPAGSTRGFAECAITIMSDVNNPLCGERGATAIFGPQKGVRADDIATIDATLARLRRAGRARGRAEAPRDRPGAGAAGGLGFALQLVGGSFRSGAEVVADLIGLDAALAGADWAFTGEGRTDAQTLLRKAPFVVAERARAAGVPITLLSGAVDAAALPELGASSTAASRCPPGR